jgi:hypothetical protein
MADTELIEGYTCTCGEHHKYPAYVFSHYYEVLVHTCEKCGAKHEILEGEATLIESNAKN